LAGILKLCAELHLRICQQTRAQGACLRLSAAQPTIRGPVDCCSQCCKALNLSLTPLQAIALVGEFNGWQPQDNHWAVRNDFGVWELFLPDGADGSPAVQHK
jgi:Carbohydrate-binding module 48 (Isoamylase N-terminal domain)